METIYHVFGCIRTIRRRIIVLHLSLFTYFLTSIPFVERVVLLFCPGVVTSEMFDSRQNAEIISTLTKEFNEVREGKR